MLQSRITRRKFATGSLGLLALSSMSTTLGSSSLTVARTPAAVATTTASSQPTGAQFPIWNRCDTCTPTAGGDLKVGSGLFDIWSTSATIWTYAVGAMTARNLVMGSLLTFSDPSATTMVPQLAESWALSPDGTTATFHLRHGVMWHDGQPFTAKDVEYTIRAHLAKDTASSVGAALKLDKLVGAAEFIAGSAPSVSGVQVVDDFTVSLTTTTPVYFLFNLTMLPILPQHVLGQVPYKDLQANKFTQEPIGTGPFKFSRRVPDQFTEYVRNDQFYLGKPLLDRIINNIYRDTTTALLAFQNGEVDLLYVQTGPDFNTAKAVPDTVLLGGPVDYPNAYVFNTTRPYLSDKRVRQALMWAIDNEAIKNNLYGDLVQLTNSVLPSPLWADPNLPNMYTYNPDKARQLLSDANWDPNQQLVLNYYYSDQNTANQMVAVQQYWADVGVQMQPQFTDAPTATQGWKTKNFDVSWVGATGSVDPSLIGPFIQCDATFDKGGINYSWYCNPQVDALIQQGQSVADYDQRKPIYNQLQEILNDDAPYVPVWTPVRVAVTRKKVVNATYYQDYADGNYEHNFEKWYLSG
jgi:peptide/nickel transport system substrate-binding protein